MENPTKRLVAREIINELLKRKPKDKREVESIKRKICSRYGLKLLTNPEILLHAKSDEYNEIRELLRIKPIRTSSGVSVVAVMTSPWPCPHGKCIYCPGGVNSSFGDTPQSYTGLEPAARRGKRNDYDAFLQVMNRLEQYIAAGHYPQKIEVIVMGGTFLSRPNQYKYGFIRDIFLGVNVFGEMFYNNEGIDIEKYKEFFEMPGTLGDMERINRIKQKLFEIKKKYSHLSLKQLQEMNENARIRIVGLTIETRPDWAFEKEILEMLDFGTTRVEIGVQSVYEKVLKLNNREHGVREIIKSFQLLKDSSFKINAHIMLGLYGSTHRMDILTIKKLFSDQRFRPDMLKIYPTLLFRGTPLYNLYEKGLYKPIDVETAADIIAESYRFIPRYVRVMRIQRDIPSTAIDAGPRMTNLRQLVVKKLKEKDITPKDIRSRQIGIRKKGKELFFKTTRYKASNGNEFFIEAIDENDNIYGFIRMRIPYKPFINLINEKTALIRELHVYGGETPISKKGDIQHRGIGSRLLSIAEEKALSKGMEKVIIISGVGVRPYYYKHGYKKCEWYVCKELK